MGNFRGFNGGGGSQMQQLMRQAQKMQEELIKKQEELDSKIFKSTVGGGMVEVEMTGKGEIEKLTIKKEAVDPDDVEMLEDMIKAAINDAHKQVETAKNDSMGNLGGMGLGF